MIIYQPNYLGLFNIKTIVAHLSGGDGAGSPFFPLHLNILGKNMGVHAGLQVGPKSLLLSTFLHTKTGLEVEVFTQGDVAATIPFLYWVSFSAETRSDYPKICAQIIVMAYLTLNNLVNWQPQP